MSKQILARKVITATKRESRKSETKMSPSGNTYEYRAITLEGEVVVSIDLDAVIAQLGTAALRSKGKTAQECNGALVVTAHNIKQLSQTEWQ
jgi:hypothetical protein